MALDDATVLVTGGCGQVGIAIVDHLQKHHPQAHIVVLDLAKPTHGRARATENVIYFTGDITNTDIVGEVLNNVRPSVVFHTAGLIPQIAKRLGKNSEKDYTAVNFQSTKLLLEAAGAAGTVKAFVYTSSADVVKGDSWQDLVNVNESQPIPVNFDNPYAKSKALAESLILSSSTATLPTTAIRTHAVFSTNDNNLLPLLLSAPRNIHLGSGQNLYDFTYAPNLAHAHVLAAQNLLNVSPAEASNPASAAGKPFFVTNAEPLPFRTFLTMLWAADDARRGLRPGKVKGTTLPKSLALGLTWVSEKGARIAGREPALSMKNLGDGLAQRWFDNSAAKEVLGYVPTTPLAKGLEEVMAEWNAGK